MFNQRVCSVLFPATAISWPLLRYKKFSFYKYMWSEVCVFFPPPWGRKGPLWQNWVDTSQQYPSVGLSTVISGLCINATSEPAGSCLVGIRREVKWIILDVLSQVSLQPCCSLSPLPQQQLISAELLGMVICRRSLEGRGAQPVWMWCPCRFSGHFSQLCPLTWVQEAIPPLLPQSTAGTFIIQGCTNGSQLRCVNNFSID